MPRIPPLDRPATYDDLMKVPDIMVAEIVDGELHASPRPAPRHANATSAVASAVHPPYHHGRGGPGGWLILFEPELHLGRNVLVPDVAGWRRARMPRLPAEAYFPLAPDWVCEVLSPSTASLDRVKKLAIYAREQVGHAWLIDPAARTLEVLRL
jgi:Uma2 family endonuclease